MKIDNHICERARLSKDARFDGLFFTAVKTTGIYCRPICPAPAPKAKNVEYFTSSCEAASAGYRPCLRCRPDSAPASFAWKGTDTTLERAMRLLDAESSDSMAELAQRLGVSDRYLRKLFKEKIGISPKQYQLHQQLLFAKKLLHESDLSVTEVAFSAGFGSVRRFNEVFQQQLKLTPSKLRDQRKQTHSELVSITLSYRPPYNVQRHLDFLNKRRVAGLEWIDEYSYGRSFKLADSVGWFTADYLPNKPFIHLQVATSDLSNLKAIIWQIRRVLDMDANLSAIETQMINAGLNQTISGIRLPGIWSLFEAGIRAVLGQQVSVSAATNLVNQVVAELGVRQVISGKLIVLFPEPQSIAKSELTFLKMPQSRKDTLKRLAEFYVQNPHCDNPAEWLTIKGIGPWTVDYAKMRGLSDSDVFLAKDLGIVKACKAYDIDSERAKPWRSYLTFNLWNML